MAELPPLALARVRFMTGGMRALLASRDPN